MTRDDMVNVILHRLQEPGPDTGQPVSGDFPVSVITRDVNLAIDQFVAFTGMEPGLTDKRYSGAIVAGLDYTLPTDLISLARIEYTQLSNGLSYARTLEGVSFAEWDARTGGGATTPQTGGPYLYREPYGPEGATQLRFFPQPNAANVSAGDTIQIYYTGQNTLLVNGSDVPGIPRIFHMAPVFLVLAEYATRKTTNDPSWVQFFEGRANRLIAMAKEEVFNRNRATGYAVGDENALSEPTYGF